MVMLEALGAVGWSELLKSIVHVHNVFIVLCDWSMGPLPVRAGSWTRMPPDLGIEGSNSCFVLVAS